MGDQGEFLQPCSTWLKMCKNLFWMMDLESVHIDPYFRTFLLALNVNSFQAGGKDIVRFSPSPVFNADRRSIGHDAFQDMLSIKTL